VNREGKGVLHPRTSQSPNSFTAAAIASYVSLSGSFGSSGRSG
jgi:hypothetical protein